MLVTDARCVQFLSETEVLAGVGNQLQYFYVKDEKTLCQTCPRRTRYKIGEIRHLTKGHEVKIIAAAGSELLVTSISDNSFRLTNQIKINDWINNIHFGSNSIFCVTAHNRLAELSVDHLSVSRRSRCPETSTAYCSLIEGDSWEILTLFAGTAFGEIIIWRPVDEQGTIILRVPNSHNGVIFDIQVNRESSLLTTCSDDRSLQLWKINENSGKISLEKIKRCFAHTSRVFRSKIIKNNENFYILSVGEDSHVCLLTHTGNLLYKKFIEECGTIWGLDYNEKSQIVLIVTNNGRILKIPLIDKFNEKSVKTDIIPYSSVTKLRYMSPELLICLTASNKIVTFDVRDPSHTKLELQLDPNLKICVMETFKHRLYLVTTESEVIFYEFLLESGFERKNMFKFENCKKKRLIRSLIILNDHSLLLCSDHGDLWHVNAMSFEKFGEYRVPKCSEPWITSACETNAGFLVGDRCGHLHLYEKSDANPIHTLRRLHGNMGITQIVKKGKIFLTTGHDATRKTIRLENHVLNHIFTEKISCMNFIERSSDLFTFGFNSSYFVCHHEKDGILIEHNCGGGNRQYDLLFDGQTLAFAVIQQRKVKQVVFRVHLSDQTSLNFSDVRWHHLSCNFMTIFTNNECPLLISGGEDTFLKFYRLSKNSLELVKTSNQHNSGIKSMIFVKDTNLLVSVGSRAIICLTRISQKNDNFLIEELQKFMLYEETHEKGVSFDPEASFTSVASIFYENEHFLVCGCSDGYLRVLKLALAFEKPSKIVLESEIYYGRSILHVKAIVEDSLILTFGTDGVVNFRKFPSLDLIHSIKHHSSGIHAFDVREHESHVLIATGGDDQSIVVSKINVKSFEINTEKTFVIPDLHTAQVTGVKFLDEQTLLTVGVDQCIYETHFDIKLNRKIVQNRWWTSIEDAKGLIHFNDKIIVYGNGIEII